MIYKNKIYLFTILTIVFLIVPLAVYAQNSCLAPISTNDTANTAEHAAIAANEEGQGEARVSTSQQGQLNYIIAMDGNTVSNILASNMRAGEVLDVTAENTNPDLQYYADHCAIVPNDPNSGSGCYILYNKKSWDDPSIQVKNGDNKPAWAFLLEVKSRAAQLGDTDSLNKIKTVSANYVASAFVKDLEPNFDFTSTSGTITIPYQQFFDELKSKGIDQNDPNVEISGNSGNQIATMKFAPTYSGAKENSAWLAAAKFVETSMILPYKNAGLDSTQYEAAINQARTNYVLGITKEDKGKVMTLTYPKRMLLSQAGQQSFKYAIDTKAFAAPSGGYKTKIYIKPASKKDANIFIQFGPFSQPEYQFSWSEAVGSGYIDTNGQRATVSGSDYDLSYPQQYIIRAITYDGATEKDNILATFETHTADTIGAGGEAVASSPFLKISAAPATVQQGTPVIATINVINSSDPAKQIKKVVFYACSSDSATVIATGSDPCLYENEDAKKAAFIIPGLIPGSEGNLIFDSYGKATVSAEWKTSGSSVGKHALMAKAFTANVGGYIDGSQTLVDITVTNSTVGAGAGGGGTSDIGDDLLAGLFNKRASDNPTGSPIRTLGGLADRIVRIFLLIIGGLSVIAIIVGGIFYITSGGDQQKAEKGKKTVLYACIGIAITVLTYVIEGAVLNIINDLVK